ncbi:MAG: AEC family transporter [Acidobacteriota bacterium]
MQTLLSILTADIVPIFLIAGAGWLLAKVIHTSAKALTEAVFHVLLPCFVFHMLVSASLDSGMVGRMILVATLVMGITGVVGFIVGRSLRLSRPELSGFLLVVMFSNGGNYGLPVVSFAFGPAAMPYATVYFLTGSLLTWTVGGFLAAAGNRSLKQALLSVLKMPNLYAIATALIVVATGTVVPAPITRAVGMLSDAALPLMIVILGIQLHTAIRPARPSIVVIAVLLSIIGTPIIAFGLTSLFGLTGPARQAAVVLASMPVAVTTSILAIKFDADPDFAMSAIFVSTILSPFTLTPIIAYLQ